MSATLVPQAVRRTNNSSPVSFLYYYFYTLLHALVARRRVASSTPFFKSIKHALTSPTSPVLLGVPTELAVGFAAGVASRAVSTPLSVVTVRLQTGAVEEDAGIDDNGKPPTNGPVHPDLSPRAPSSFFQVVKSIYLEDGLSGFWAGTYSNAINRATALTSRPGFRPTLPLCLTPALTLLLFKLLSRLRLSRTTSPPRPTGLSAFLSGAFANALAVTILYPLLLAKVRIQAAKSRGVEPGAPRPTATTVWDVWVAAVRQDGWAGLYQALSAQILKGVVSQGVTMLVKQRSVHLHLDHLDIRDSVLIFSQLGLNTV